MIDPESQAQLKHEIAMRMLADRALLDQLRTEIRPLRSAVRRIQARTAAAISLVATDGGNTQLQFDPFLVQLVRVVDSSNNEYCLEAVTPSTSVMELGARQFGRDGTPSTALGEMMAYLGVTSLPGLSAMIQRNEGGRPTNSRWVQDYRELVEWATLFHIIHEKDFGSDTLIVYDGLLRSKVFARDLFARYLRGIGEGMASQERRSRRRIYLAGVARQSKGLDRYRLAMALEGVLTTDYPAYVEVPPDIEENAYLRPEYARGDDQQSENAESNKIVGGKMFFVKFGSGRRDPIWPIDIYLPQRDQAQVVIGYLLADAINGFPAPFYPQCLQKAHEYAAVGDFDRDILQDNVFEGIRAALGDEAQVLDVFRLQDGDAEQGRYRSGGG